MNKVIERFIVVAHDADRTHVERDFKADVWNTTIAQQNELARRAVGGRTVSHVFNVNDDHANPFQYCEPMTCSHFDE